MTRSLAFHKAPSFDAEHEYLLLEESDVLPKHLLEVRIDLKLWLWTDERHHFLRYPPGIE